MSDLAQVSEPFDLFTLSERALREATYLINILSLPVSTREASIIEKSYGVPAPGALADICATFRSIAEWPGLTPAIYTREGDQKARLDVICALASAFRNVQGQMNIRRFETSYVIHACLNVFTLVNSGERELLEARMRRSIDDRRNYDIWRR